MIDVSIQSIWPIVIYPITDTIDYMSNIIRKSHRLPPKEDFMNLSPPTFVYELIVITLAGAAGIALACAAFFSALSIG